MPPRPAQDPNLSLPPPPHQEEVSPPGFQPVTRWPGPASRDQPAPGQPEAGAAGGASGSSGPPPRTPTDDPRPPPRPPVSKEKAKAYEAIARGLLKAAGGLLNKRFQVSDDDESWLPDEDDEAMIPPPVGRLAARRVPIGDGQDLTDLEDIGMAAVGLVAWAGKGAVAMWEARRARRRARHPLQQAGTVVFQDDGQDQEDQQP